MMKKGKNSAPKNPEILLVEDSLTQATQINHLLESQHYKVSVSQNGKQAMDWLSKHKPSLVISDIVMPEMNGYELCKKIKLNKNTEGIPVILLTRLSDPEEIIEGLSCGADSFITKPFNEKYLLSHIEKILYEGNRADHEKMPFGVQILFKGKKRLIQAEQQNVIKLMLNIYEGAIQQNERLAQTREELRLLNERLETLVEVRTSDLSEEIKLSNQIANRLKESEERYRTLYNDAVVGLYRTNPQGKILLANLALVKMLGFQSFEELAAINLNRTGVGTTQQRQKFIDLIEKEGEIKDLEAVWICRDGKEIFVRENAKAIYDSKGKILYYDGTVQDITEQKRAAEALNEIQHLFETLALVSPVGIFRTDVDGHTNYVNPKYSELTGLSFDEAMGRGWLNTVHSDDKEKLNESWSSDLKSRKISSSEYRFIRSDGSIVWVMGNAVPEWIDNKIVGYIGTITDITGRKQSEKALQESEEKFRSIMENSADAIFITDQHGNYVYTNKAVTSMLGYSSEEMKSKSIIDITPKNETDKYFKIFNHVLVEGKVFTEIELLKKDGNFISTDLNSVLLPGGLVYGSCRDITERKLTEKALKHAKEKAEASDNLKTTFLNNISHEVRTPMNGILGFAEIMSHSDLSEEEKKDSRAMLQESSDRLLNTITNYMDISLITSGNLSVNKKDFIPGQILRRIFDNYKMLCSNRKLELLLSIPAQSENISVNSDPEIFQKIISHLLNNAVKFTEKGSINYGYNIHKGELEFFVKDTGIGIGEESIHKIFDHFVKEDLGPTRLTEGSGLGLSIAKGMIEIIGGNIQVESEVRVGSCFYFTIPLMKETEIITSINSGGEFKRIRRGASILVAEDDETNFFYLNALLTRETGANVIHASNGREAIELFKVNPDIQLILMDIKMPEVDGFEATRQIKLLKKEVPVIAITAYAMSGDEAKVIAAGCDAYLSKPISKKILLEKMAEFIPI